MRAAPLRSLVPWSAAVAVGGVVVAVVVATATARPESPAPSARRGAAATTPWPAMPGRLSETGLWADPTSHRLADDVLTYTPQYPLWTDGATKRRFLRLPPGASIDASDPDRFEFPVGTELWKEFSFGRRVETRRIVRTPDGWVFATYRWDDDGRDATLVAPEGARGVAEIAPGVRHDLPSRSDCRACHGAGRNVVLGVGALQLSPDRDPLAPRAETPAAGDVDLAVLVERGLVRGLPPTLRERAPRVSAATPRGRAALGYLHGNCGACHDAVGALAPLGLVLAQPARGGSDASVASLLGRAGRFRTERGDVRVTPGDPAHSTLLARLRSRSPLRAMPPLGTRLVDEDAVALLEAWVREDLAGGGLATAPAASAGR